MRWYLINKFYSIQPKKGNYNDPEWKEQIRLECFNQCIYCAIHENSFGGPRNYHVEHYRPKSLESFKDLIKDIKNLFYACGICNSFKGNDWPNDWPNEDTDLIAYPDPSLFDYNTLFSVNDSYLLTSESASGKYMIHKLFLNRPQLINERREHMLTERYAIAMSELSKAIASLVAKPDSILSDIQPSLLKYIEMGETLRSLLNQRRQISPYSTFETLRER